MIDSTRGNDVASAYGVPATSTSLTSPHPSHFSSLPTAVIDEVFAQMLAHAQDPSSKKVLLGAGVYRDNDLKPWPLPVVEKVERQLLAKADLGRHEYLSIAGDPEFLELARDLAFGFDKKADNGNTHNVDRIASAQTISGTGANHIGALFLSRFLKPARVWISDPTWANHLTIWDEVNVPITTYPYYNPSTNSFAFDEMIATLEEKAQPNDVILLHACAHNPTGIDPTKDQWRRIASLCARKRLFPFFDSAYQGFASGSPLEDTWSIQYFMQTYPEMEMIVAQSFSKNFGLYGHRVGALHIVTTGSSPHVRDAVSTNLSHFLRAEFSMAPRYGSTIVKTVLSSPELTAEWHANLTAMSGRIKQMRQALYEQLVKLETPGTWNHVIEQIGMFSYTGLSAAQADALKEKWHVYLLRSGRVSICGCKFILFFHYVLKC